MPALNFQARFAGLVESGAKRQTIRKRRKDGRDPKPSDTLHFFTAMRTKACRRLGRATCTSVDPVYVGVAGIKIGCDWIDVADEDVFARADGFASAAELIDWFSRTHGLPFEGLLIRWGDLSPPPEPAA